MTTPTSTTAEPRPIDGGGSGENPCVDDEDCPEGSGEEVKPVYTPKTSTDDIYLNTPEPAKQPSYGDPDEDTFPGYEDHTVRPPRPNTVNNMVITVNMTETPPRRPGVTPRHHDSQTEPPGSQAGGGMHTGTGTGKQTPNEGNLHQGFGPLGLNIGLIVGIAAGVLLLLLILAYALYKYKSRDEGSYKIDETRNYPYDSPIPKPSPTVNGGHAKPGMHGPPPSNKSGKKKDVKEWYV